MKADATDTVSALAVRKESGKMLTRESTSTGWPAPTKFLRPCEKHAVMGEPSWTSEAWEQIPPVAGWYRMRRPPAYAGEHWSKRPWLPVLVHFSAPLDPDTGEVLDRAPRWGALLDGREVDISVVWPWCARNEVSEAEYEELINAQ